MDNFEYGEQFMFTEITKEIQMGITMQMFKWTPRYDMKIELEKYKSDYNNCSLKDYKEIKAL